MELLGVGKPFQKNYAYERTNKILHNIKEF